MIWYVQLPSHYKTAPGFPCSQLGTQSKTKFQRQPWRAATITPTEPKHSTELTHISSCSCSMGNIWRSLVRLLWKMLLSSSMTECLSVVQGTSTSTCSSRSSCISPGPRSSSASLPVQTAPCPTPLPPPPTHHLSVPSLGDAARASLCTHSEL